MKHNTMKTGILGALVALGVMASATADAQNAPPAQALTLWYQQPAADDKPMNEALPIGNGDIMKPLFKMLSLRSSGSVGAAGGLGLGDLSRKQ
jgi:hypothetical protein